MTVRRPPSRVGGALSSVVLVGLGVLTGCGTSDVAAPEPAPAPSAAATSSTASTAPPSPAVELPATCAEVVTVSQVTTALGAPLPGTTSTVVGAAEPDIGRTGRLTCGFGVAPGAGTTGTGDALLEVSVFDYTDAPAAAERARDLAAAQESQGVRVGPADVPGADAALVLASAVDTTVVATVASRTWALTLVPGLLDGPGAQAALERLATVVVAAGAPGGPTAGPTSPSAGGAGGTSAPTG